MRVQPFMQTILLIVALCYFLSLLKMSNTEKRVDNISLACWNSRGLTSALPYLNKLFKSHDFICISEHWQHANRLNTLNDISADFDVISRSSKHADSSKYGFSRGQGGVALFWRRDIKGVTPVTSLTNDRICGVRFQPLSGRTINIYSIYLPSPGSSDSYESTLDDIAGLISEQSDGSLSIFCGDWNADMGYLGGQKSTRQPSRLGKTTAKFFEEFSLHACNLAKTTKGPLNTFNGGTGSSTLDYIAVPLCFKRLVLECEVLEDPILNLSDHNAVHITLEVEKHVCLNTTQPIINNVKWAKIDRNTIREGYTTQVNNSCNEILQNLDINECSEDGIDNLVNNITTLLVEKDKNLPRSKYVKHIRPFWNENLTQLKRDKIICYKNWKNDGCPRSLTSDSWVAHKNAKRIFRREIKKIQRDFERDEVNRILETAEFNRNKFWKIVKRYRNSSYVKTSSVRNPQGTVFHETADVIPIWRNHFSKLCMPNTDERYDQDHFDHVTRKVDEWAKYDDPDVFLNEPFTINEVKKCIKGLNRGKAAGFDAVTAEHLQNAGESLVVILTHIFNRIIDLEFIPKNFRIGTQIPLYKGKNTCSLDPNNYRGITLLTSLNKVFEMLIWGRVKDWWYDERVISPLQGACHSGMSCLHTALTLQETIAVGLDSNKKVFVAYFDVAKAFDGVWIDGLFYQIRKMGLTGKIWRLLYLSYQNFWCKVRINGTYSDWYQMQCGIHQGGYLSLLKYTAFIDPLLRQIEESGLCCKISGIPSSPLGYADDMATACLSKTKLDNVLKTVYSHSIKWRYSYNAAKSAVMIYGETRNEHAKGKKHRLFKLGPQKVPEKCAYEHVGVKNCLFGDFSERLEDRISKGRRCFNALCSLGIKKRGITIKTCATLFWSIVIPVTTYGSELWVLKGSEIEKIRKFQREIGRRCQRFPDRSPNHSAYTALGWLSIDRMIQVKKLMFLRTITNLEEDAICKKVLITSAQRYTANFERSQINEANSPIYDMLNTAKKVGLLDICMNTIINGHFYTKQEWKNIVWQTIWHKEDEDCFLLYTQPKPDNILFNVIENTYYLIWWRISDIMPEKTRMCEILASIVCDTSLLKATDYRLKKKTGGFKMCERCYLGCTENARHIIMQCPFYTTQRTNMFNEIEQNSEFWTNNVVNQGHDILHILLGKQPEGILFEEFVNILLISGKYICDIYKSVITGRV